MSYEQAVRARHEFEDSFNTLLKVVSVLEDRELEITAAKIGDGLKDRDDSIDPKSALLTAKIIQMTLRLRASRELSQSNIMRIWLRRKKKQFAFDLAQIALKEQFIQYQIEKERAQHLREKELHEYNHQVHVWERLMKSLSLWQRIFDRPPPPREPNLTPLPCRPMDPHIKSQMISRSKDFGEILIDVIYHYKFPHIEYAEEYVREDNIKSSTQKLLEAKG